jgi:hypothetical protein
VEQVEKQKKGAAAGAQGRKRPDLDLVGTLLTSLMKKLKKEMEDNQDLSQLLRSFDLFFILIFEKAIFVLTCYFLGNRYC